MIRTTSKILHVNLFCFLFSKCCRCTLTSARPPIARRYERAEVTSDGTYPDKNTVADAITTSIITNRFLVEAALMPWSMAIHFTDIASVHLLILKVTGQ